MANRAGVLGFPINHSLSPVLHRAAYEALGLDWTYDAIEMTPEDMPAFVASLDDSWLGLSLTMPLKESVQPLLADIDQLAHVTNSVNTMYRSDKGWIGANTDVFGIEHSLRQAGLTGATSARLLGAGATARSAVAAMRNLRVESLIICARRADKAREVALLAQGFGMEVLVSDLTPVPVEEDLLISVLPGDIAAPWASVPHSPHCALLDASYHPWPSALGSAWSGSIVASGRDMLLWQATEQVELMTGRPAPVADMRFALERL